MNEVRVDFTGDASGIKAAAHQSAAALDEVRKAKNALAIANADSSKAALDYIEKLKQEAATLGMTATQKRVYEAAVKGASQTDQEAVRILSDKIEAHGRAEKAMVTAGRAGAVAGAAIAAGLVKVLKDSVTAAMEAEQAMLRLDAVYKASGGASGLTRGALDSMAENLKEKTGFDDDKIRESMAVLLTFRNIGRESFGEVMSVAADLSRVMGTDLQSATVMLGKALENPESGLTALTRAGVSFSDSQKQNIKDMVEMGRQAEAITEILRLMREQGINGAAEAMNTGLSNATNDLRLAWDDMLKSMGKSPELKATVEGTFGAIARKLEDVKRISESGDWLDKVLLIAFNYTSPSMRKENQWEGSVGGSEARKAREAQEAQRRQRLADQRSSFMREYETPAQKRDRELNRAAHLFSGSDDLETALEAVRKKFSRKGPAQKDDFGELMNRLSGLDPNFSKELETLHKRYDSGRISLDEYRGAVEKLIDKQPFAQAQHKEQKKFLEEEAKARKEVLDAAFRQLDQLDQEADRLRLHNEEIGLTKEQLAALKVARLDDAIAIKERQAAVAAATSDDAAYIETLKEQAERLRDIRNLTASGAARQAAADAAKKPEEEWKRTSENIERSLTDALMRGFEGGKDAGKNFRDTLRNMFKTLVLQPLLKPIVEPVSRAMSGIGQAISDALLRGMGGSGTGFDFGGTPSGALDFFVADGLHSGGIAGREPSFTRRLPASVFDGAPRLHGGGIAGDEVPAILRRGEGVFTEGQMRAMGGVTNNVSVIVNAEGGRVQGDTANAAELGRRIDGAVRGVLLKEMQPGGLLAGA